MDASYKIQRGIHVHLIQFFMCPEFWVHISDRPAAFEGAAAACVPNPARGRCEGLSQRPLFFARGEGPLIEGRR